MPCARASAIYSYLGSTVANIDGAKVSPLAGEGLCHRLTEACVCAHEGDGKSVGQGRECDESSEGRGGYLETLRGGVLRVGSVRGQECAAETARVSWGRGTAAAKQSQPLA